MLSRSHRKLCDRSTYDRFERARYVERGWIGPLVVVLRAEIVHQDEFAVESGPLGQIRWVRLAEMSILRDFLQLVSCR